MFSLMSLKVSLTFILPVSQHSALIQPHMDIAQRAEAVKINILHCKTLQLAKEYCVLSLPNINVLISYPTRPAQWEDRGPNIMRYVTTSYNKQQCLGQTNPRMETPLKIWFDAVRENQNKEH